MERRSGEEKWRGVEGDQDNSTSPNLTYLVADFSGTETTLDNSA